MPPSKDEVHTLRPSPQPLQAMRQARDQICGSKIQAWQKIRFETPEMHCTQCKFSRNPPHPSSACIPAVDIPSGPNGQRTQLSQKEYFVSDSA
mmetsp:Transcript_19035/g.38521  ORF Transcript_19035/g.38521 Transcript_19035/m.38521 type:complete len:93 (-) Transcript_19035:1223-1501(-)